MLIGAVFIPPKSGIEKYIRHCISVDEALSKSTFSEVVILGDYNLPSFNSWEILEGDGFVNDISLTLETRSLLETFSFHGMVQINKVHNNFGKMLDLIFVRSESNAFKVSQDDLPMVECDAYHPCISIQVFLMGPNLINFS
ncbi:hypothetical protein J437_LFUL010266, partial [Ladona fulva]